MDLPPGLSGFVSAEREKANQGAQRLQGMTGVLGLSQMLRQQAFEDQMQPLRLQQLQASVAQAKQDAALFSHLQGMIGGVMPSAGGAPMAFGEGGMSLPGGGQANAITGQTAPAPQQGNSRGTLGGVDPMAAMFMASHNPGISKIGTAMQEANKPMAAREGAPVINPQTGQIMFYAPKLDAGVLPTFENGRVTGASAIPGYGAATASIKGAETAASEDAKAARDIVQVPDGRGGMISMPRSQAVTALGGGQQALPELRTNAPTAQDALRMVREADARGQQASVTAPGTLGRTQSAEEKAASEVRGKTTATREAEAPTAALQAGSQFDNFDRLTAMANQVLNAPGLGRAVGLPGALPSLPGSSATDATAMMDSLKAQVSGMKLQAMRDASKTGGAVGNVTEKEWPRLEAMIVALNPRMGGAAFREQVGQLVKEIQISKQRIQDAYSQEYGGTQGAVPPAQRPGSAPARGRPGGVVKWSDL